VDLPRELHVLGPRAVARPGHLQDRRESRQGGMSEKARQRHAADGSLPEVRVTVGPRPKGNLRVVQVEAPQRAEADRCVERGHDVVRLRPSAERDS
jgi:hypothetical protein